MQVKFNTYLTFQRRLLPNEEAEFSAVLKQGKEMVGNTGHSVLIMPSASLPQSINTGVGNMLDPEGLKFFDFAKQYWGINYIQLLPEGTPKIYADGRVLPYSGSTFDLGSHVINMELLTKEKYGKLLSAEDINLIVSKNKSLNVNYENVIAKESITEGMLRKAYNELVKADSSSKKEILKDIEQFSKKNRNWLEPKSLFEALSFKYKTRDIRKWDNVGQNLFNEDIVKPNQRKSVIENIQKSDLAKEIHFFEFKQFLAESHLEEAKKELNKKGIKISGDALAGFSFDEVWANPKAFSKNHSIGYGLPALNLDSAEAEKLLRQKFNKFAQRYDGIRLDMSWAYITQPLIDSSKNTVTRKEYGDKILSIIEDEIIKVKGIDFNLENITHEMVASKKDFNLFNGDKLREAAKNRNKIFCSSNLNNEWATVENFTKRGWPEGSYTLGATNHDSESLRKTFANTLKREQQSEVLSKILKLPKEILNNFATFTQAKFAEPMRSRHNMVFFTEALNIAESYKDNPKSADDYRIKLTKTYQDEYFKALEKGEGLNIMDALDKAFVSKGLDKKEPDLYKKIVKFKKILQSPENGGGEKKINLAIGFGVGVLMGLIYLFTENKKRADKTGSNAR